MGLGARGSGLGTGGSGRGGVGVPGVMVAAASVGAVEGVDSGVLEVEEAGVVVPGVPASEGVAADVLLSLLAVVGTKLGGGTVGTSTGLVATCVHLGALRSR